MSFVVTPSVLLIVRWRTKLKLSNKEKAFIEKVWQEGERLYRDLAWRGIDDPYAVLVSEVMLQQTQVSRVERYWSSFMKLFPTIDALASAEVSLVLETWQGLGYNRRALMLKRCAEQCSEHYQGALPKTREELMSLPGIGSATAGGIMAFAYNQPVLYLETNVRTVFLHEFFPEQDKVSDKTLEPYILNTCSQDNPRGWYYALLDYGNYLKKTLPNPSRRSKHYAKQSTFEGSRRQKRAELVRVVLAQPGISFSNLFEELQSFEQKAGRDHVSKAEFESILSDLIKEGFFAYNEMENSFTSH